MNNRVIKIISLAVVIAASNVCSYAVGKMAGYSKGKKEAKIIKNGDVQDYLQDIPCVPDEDDELWDERYEDAWHGWYREKSEDEVFFDDIDSDLDFDDYFLSEEKTANRVDLCSMSQETGKSEEVLKRIFDESNLCPTESDKLFEYDRSEAYKVYNKYFDDSEMECEGYFKSEIARILGVSTNVVTRIIKKYEISPNGHKNNYKGYSTMTYSLETVKRCFNAEKDSIKNRG